MKTVEELKAKVTELKQIGSPSALSKARELEWALGVGVEPDEEADRLTDALLSSLDGQVDLMDQVPEFARGHNLYTFHRQEEARKTFEAGGRRPPAGLTHDEQEDWWNNFYRKSAELTKGKSFRWSNLLGKDLLHSTRKLLKKKGSINTYDDGFYTRVPDEAASADTAELIASVNQNGLHRPLLDIDFPAVVIPSTTEGHCHLYIDKEMPWKDYKKLLNVLADLDIIEHGYRGASLARGYSALRLPWIKKEKDTSKNDEVLTQTF